MADVFLSYSRADRAEAEQVAGALKATGWSVFWDTALHPGDAFDKVLARELGNASSVVVLWSANSVESDWVRDEAQQAKERGVLVPVRIEDVSIPLGFGRIHTADLVGWRGQADHPGFRDLSRALGRMVGGERLGGDTRTFSALRAARPGRRNKAVDFVRAHPLRAVLPLMSLVVIGALLLFTLSGSGDSAAVSDSPSGEPLLPSGFGMAHVAADQPVIGVADYATRTDAGPFVPERSLGTSVDFFVDENATSNAFYREWLIYEAGNDLGEWDTRSPEPWTAVAAGGFPTYPEGEADFPVSGVPFDSAAEYCRYVNKRLITETEWELAATRGAFVSDVVEVQNWVDSPEEYGPVPSGAAVLRGNFGSEDQEVHYRTIGVDGSVFRSFAGIRCASDAVRLEVAMGAPGAETFYDDDFSDIATGWPSTKPNGTFSVGYHPTDVYHVETERSGTQVMVVSVETAPADSAISTRVELRKPDGGLGRVRYGLVARASEQGYVLLTILPEVEGETRYVTWCLSQRDGPFLGTGERVSAKTTDGPPVACPEKLDEGRLEVETFNNLLSLSFTGSTPTVAIDGNPIVLAPELSVVLPQGAFGFYVESLDEGRFTHFHFDGLLVTVG